MLRSHEQDRKKRAAVARSVAEVEDDMILGLGSGSTAAFAVEAAAARIASGLFIGLASKIIVGRPTGVEVIYR